MMEPRCKPPRYPPKGITKPPPPPAPPAPHPSGPALEPDIVNARTMARMLGVGRHWLVSQAKANLLPCVEAEGTVLFNPAQVKRALIARMANTKNEELPEPPPNR